MAEWARVGEDPRQRVLLDLAKRDKSDLRGTFRAVTEGAAAVLGVGRVAIWSLIDDGAGIRCEDLFLRGQTSHGGGEERFARDFPRYFEALLASRAIAAHDAGNDPRTSEFRDTYLAPNRIRSMLDVPIWHRGQLYGVLCHEHTGPQREWRAEEIDFASNLADIIALSLEASERQTAELRWKAVVEAVAEAVVLADRKGTVVFANPVARKLLDRAGGGLTLDERLRLIDFLDAADQPIPPDRWPGPRALRGETVVGEIVGMRFRDNGELRYFRTTTAPMDGGFVSVMGEVTEDVKFAQLKRDFLATIAHELKTPVAVAKGYSQFLARTGNLPEKQRAMLDTIVRAANRMDQLIQDLVDVSNIMLGRLILSRTHVDLADVLERVVGRAARNQPSHLFATTAVRPVPVLIDVPRIEQVLRQLIDNAIRFSPGGCTISCDVVSEGLGAVLSIHDHGIGIPADRRDHIFEPFYRAHAGTPHDRGGLGMGLYLAREIVRRHDGSIGFESMEGRGSSFFVRLPLARDE